MKDDFQENPYLPPDVAKHPPQRTPGLLARLFIYVTSMGASVVTFYGTCFGFLGTAGMFRSREPLALIMAAAGFIAPIPAAIFVARYLRRVLTAKLTADD